VSSERVFVCGASGSGKTELLRRAFLPRAPRLLILDQTGEWPELEPEAPVAYGFRQAAELLAAVAHLPEWTGIAYLDAPELLRLSSRLLVPFPNPRALSYARRIGGMALLADEIQTWASSSYYPPELKNLFRIGRHVRLSIYAATQRVGNCSKEVTAQCRFIAFLRQEEPLDVDYLRDRIGAAIVDQVLAHVTTVSYSAFVWDRDRQLGYLVAADGRVIRTVSRPAI